MTAAGAMTLEAEDDDSARSPSPDSPARFSLQRGDPQGNVDLGLPVEPPPAPKNPKGARQDAERRKASKRL